MNPKTHDRGMAAARAAEQVRAAGLQPAPRSGYAGGERQVPDGGAARTDAGGA